MAWHNMLLAGLQIPPRSGANPKCRQQQSRMAYKSDNPDGATGNAIHLGGRGFIAPDESRMLGNKKTLPDLAGYWLLFKLSLISRPGLKQAIFHNIVNNLFSLRTLIQFYI